MPRHRLIDLARPFRPSSFGTKTDRAPGDDEESLSMDFAEQGYSSKTMAAPGDDEESDYALLG